VIAYFKDYLQRVEKSEIRHVAKGDADIRQGAFTEA
jgi:nitrogen fixation protein NifB